MTEIIASLSEADKKFFFNQVLTDINLDVKSGEILGLIGPSGSGKTTCIRCMLGMEDLTGGEAHVLSEKMPKRKVLDKIGYMGQETGLDKRLNAHENMELFGRLKHLKGEQLKSEIDSRLKITELHYSERAAVSKFSESMKRRLSFAITLLGSPKLIVMDEPLAGADPELKALIWKSLKEHADKGAGIIIATEDMNEAEYCDRLVLLKHGEILAEGTPAELMRLYGKHSIEDVFSYMEAAT